MAGARPGSSLNEAVKLCLVCGASWRGGLSANGRVSRVFGQLYRCGGCFSYLVYGGFCPVTRTVGAPSGSARGSFGTVFQRAETSGEHSAGRGLQQPFRNGHNGHILGSCGASQNGT